MDLHAIRQMKSDNFSAVFKGQQMVKAVLTFISRHRFYDFCFFFPQYYELKCKVYLTSSHISSIFKM